MQIKKYAKYAKYLVWLVVAGLIISSAILITNYFRAGNQTIVVTTADKYYADSNLQATIDVRKNNMSTDSKVTVVLLDGDNHAVWGTRKTYKKEGTDKISVDMPLPKEIDSTNYTLKVTAKSGWDKDTKEIDININSTSKQEVIVSLDKGIYKPGDQVNYRALILSKDSNKPIEEDITVSIFDGNSNRVYVKEGKTSEFGIISGTFTLASDVNSGMYKLEVSSSSTIYNKSFKVNPYITPQYEVKIESDKESYIVGDTAKITVNAQYFFGESVKDASVKLFKGDNLLAEELTNEEGKLVYDYNVETEEAINLKAEVEDSSNYFVETSKTLYASKDIYNIEILPEYGSILKGMNNKIYVTTTKPDGSPLKTKSNVNIGTLKKQLLTDEYGIGVIELTSDEISQIGNKAIIVIDSQDYEDNKVTYSDEFDVEKSSKYAIRTDKIKYNQNDDIGITIDSTVDSTSKNIFVCKGDQLLKLYSTEENELDINLGDTFGLVDIIIANNNNGSSSYYNYNYYDDYDDYYDYDDVYTPSYFRKGNINNNSNYSKRTIFITPKNSLDVAVTTDKEEYKPGDKLNLQITTKAEGKGVDSAVLVSILDNAILSLADNDLSIDNIKLALEDIKLSEDLTAADLYAMVVEDKNPVQLETILLKQSSQAINLNTDNLRSDRYDQEDLFHLGICLAIGAIVLLLAYIVIKTKKKASTIKKALCSIFVFIVVFLFTMEGTGTLLGSAIFAAIITVILYNLILDTFSDAILEFIVYYIFLNAITFELLQELVDEEIWQLVIILIPFVIHMVLHNYFIVQKKIKNKPLEIIDAFFRDISFAYFIMIIVIILAEMFDLELLVPILYIGLFCLKRVKIDKKDKSSKKSKKIIEGKIQINIDGKAVAGILLIILLICGLGLLNIRSTFSGAVINEGSASVPSRSYEGTIGSSRRNIDIQSFDSYEDTSGAASSSSSIFKGIEDIADSFKSKGNSVASINSSVNSEVQESTSVAAANNTENVAEESTKVRNLFLESLAFLPDLVTKDGNLSQEIAISDNITSWNVQVVANTKDGNLGSAQTSFKVFKEFFVNFELPKNSVVTDVVSIPLTVYNYTDNQLDVNLNVEDADWFDLKGLTVDGNELANGIATVPANNTKLVYAQIAINKAGDNKFKVTASANGVQDIIEKSFTVTPNGLHKTNVISSGMVKDDYSQDFFATETAIENSRKITVKLYPSLASQEIENIDSILKMPTGCFEQTSSGLYPDVLALEYLNKSRTSNQELKEKALDYVSKGYQRLLTFEVPGTKGGFSLYGHKPAEVALTAFGLMELNDVSKVYTIDENVLDNMKNYLFTKGQKTNGAFKVDEDTYMGSHLANDELALNAYTIWAISEAAPDDSRLSKSIKYLEGKLSKSADNYTVALMANAFANTESDKLNDAIDILMDNVKTNSEGEAYVESKIRDYYGTYGKRQNVQTTALLSLALSRSGKNAKTNEAIVNYLLKSKDAYGSWGTTQATVLALKALNEYDRGEKLKSQTIKVTYGGQTKEQKIDENELYNYSLVFENVPEEGKISIDMEKGTLYYEIVNDYYVPYKEEGVNEGFAVTQTIGIPDNGQYDRVLGVNDIITQNISLENTGDQDVVNGLVKINIPQGTIPLEESLGKLVNSGLIKKYEYNYNTIDLYLRDTTKGAKLDLSVQYRVLYPEEITGGSVRVYDYYNPEYEGIANPQMLKVWGN